MTNIKLEKTHLMHWNIRKYSNEFIWRLIWRYHNASSWQSLLIWNSQLGRNMCALECCFSYNLSSHNHYHPINKIINFACQKNQQKSHWNANHHHCDKQENICENGNDLIIFLSVPLLSFFCYYSLSLWHVDVDHHHSFMCISVDKYHILSGWDYILTSFVLRW